jgi:hypothetical protein
MDGFLSLVIICIDVGDRIIKRGGWIQLTSLTTPHGFVCPKPGAGFPTSYVVVLFILSELNQNERWLFVLFILVELMDITV